MNNIPLTSFGFKVEIDIDDKMACFQEVSGLSIQINTEDFIEGGLNTTTHKLITGITYPNIILKRGLCNTSMYSWINNFISGNIIRLNGDIKLLDSNNNIAKTFHFIRGIPVKWTGPTLNVMTDNIATETLEIAHEGLSVF